MKRKTKAQADAERDATRRLVLDALSSDPVLLSPSDAKGLADLLPPRVVRSALRDRCGFRWAIAVDLARQALERPARHVDLLADSLGITLREARNALRDRPPGRESALEVVAAIEGVTSRTVRTRIADARRLHAARRARRGKRT